LRDAEGGEQSMSLKLELETTIKIRVMKNCMYKLTNKCLVGVLFFLVPFTASTQTNDVSLWASIGSGLYTGGYEIDDSHLIAADVNLNWKRNLVSLQLNYSPEYVFEKNNYKLYEYGALYGYMKDFKEGSFYVASGISYFDLKDNNYVRADKTELARGEIGELVNQNTSIPYKEWGVPVKLGFTTRFNNWFAIGGSYIMNINGNETYFGYNVSFQFGLFGNKESLGNE